ncbi:MAG: enoyl-CoA hydratase/isomerase family protein [Proteobacteria bacterium]|nr:enoyl-CoA hydratase/isomerase family protein [Pseudomonadota bacterium]MBU1739940.1 enoyl-CoA hydratase/isomerase family protein [Pseudomonadota bacterium]
MELTQTRYEVDRGVALVTLDRPAKMNAMTRTMRHELLRILAEADADDAVRVVVVTGAGKAFCAGADLSAGRATFDYTGPERGPRPIREHRDGAGQVVLAIHACRKPVIAAINGAAVGAGLTVTLSMDIRVVAEDARVGFVFARRGVCLEGCAGWFLPRLVGIAKAAELAYTGRVFPAADEAGSGLFNHVVPAGEVLTKAMAIAREIVDNTSAVSVALNKALLWHGLSEPDPQSQHLIDSKCFYWIGRQPDAAEGIDSFLEKRPPQFTMSPTKDLPDFYPWWTEPKV